MRQHQTKKRPVNRLIEDIRKSANQGELAAAKLNALREYYKAEKEKNKLLETIEALSEAELDKQKRLEYYSQSVAGMINTSLEKDKSIFTMSIAGIGFILSQLKPNESTTINLLYISSAILFISCAFIAIKIFDNNKLFLKTALKKDNTREAHLRARINIDRDKIQKKLVMLDKTLEYTFIAALLITSTTCILNTFK